MARLISPALFAFLRDLQHHNDREWFKANKPRYEADARTPALDFVAAFGAHLGKISKHFVADPRPSGGSMFRIHRDTRFSKDKSPYKTHVGLHFRHASARDAHAPGFYLHLEPGGCFAGAGIWHPNGETVTAIRDAMVADPTAYRRLLSRKAFARDWRLGGESLKRAPRGYDPEHELIDELKRKDFIAVTDLSQGEVCSTDFLQQFAALCRTASPFAAFLTRALGLPY
jgi:uncharacterized protein (TIGR02453 family)